MTVPFRESTLQFSPLTTRCCNLASHSFISGAGLWVCDIRVDPVLRSCRWWDFRGGKCEYRVGYRHSSPRARAWAEALGLERDG